MCAGRGSCQPHHTLCIKIVGKSSKMLSYLYLAIYVYRFTYVCIASDLYVVNPKRTTCVVCETAAVM